MRTETLGLIFLPGLTMARPFDYRQGARGRAARSRAIVRHRPRAAASIFRREGRLHVTVPVAITRPRSACCRRSKDRQLRVPRTFSRSAVPTARSRRDHATGARRRGRSSPGAAPTAHERSRELPHEFGRINPDDVRRTRPSQKARRMKPGKAFYDQRRPRNAAFIRRRCGWPAGCSPSDRRQPYTETISAARRGSVLTRIRSTAGGIILNMRRKIERMRESQRAWNM
jgi:hypothetical protein